MNINKELAGLNRRIARLQFKESPPALRMKVLQSWEVEEETDINDEYCIVVRIEEKNPDLLSSKL